jgi:glycine/D-amino acid oxidase-like deaminating enzyme
MALTTSDGSLWLMEAPAAQNSHPSLRGQVSADVAVIGGGIAGATLALALQANGAQVVLAEARQVGSGVTATTCRARFSGRSPRGMAPKRWPTMPRPRCWRWRT